MFSHNMPKYRYRLGVCKERKGKEEYLYSAVLVRTHTLKVLRHGPHSFTCKRSPDGAAPITEAADIELQLTTHLSTPKDERLSWPGWLTYSGWPTHLSGHPSATGRAQDSESTTAKDRCSTAGPRHQHRCSLHSYKH